MSRFAVTALALVLLQGCASAEKPAISSGEEAYRSVCARCHDAGLQGAPRLGVAEDWEGRSWLWEAVLFEHAKRGFNEMPAKGGETELDDAVVEKAVEYMLQRVVDAPSAD